MSGISPFSLSKQPPLILVASDDKTMRVLLRKAMEQEGYRVVEVNDGQQCLHAYDTIKPDIVLLDAVMPVMDGFTCCKQLLKIARNNLMAALASFDTDSALGNTVISKLWERTPILMMTSLDDEESVNHAFEVGAMDYITKPIHWAVLRQRLRRLLQQAQVYKQLEAANQALQHMANVDSLTGLANRRRFDDYLNTQWINLAQEELPLSLIMCDVDFFKPYVDQYGHSETGTCLSRLGQVIAHTAQKNQDLAARISEGDEFAVIMPNTHAVSAVHVAAAMQAGVRNLKIVHSKSKVSEYVTLSIGVATMVPTWESSPSDLMLKADKALYQAKAEGRDRIILK
ncbi:MULTISPECIES: diguanylate cyclase domain-containing protein [unclassified Tolypothrix]|uniref:diguanylate cyclase domain-containing protein n=1 Tax=unclassified Tolypothrix TaxID=2649714 RepID=UPI0005EAC011|nr:MULTISPECIES: diguanylate cyclase [unclassified Tolypothrix]BAY93692.1 response regulator receiver modulated diguanylate cyclase [Microchaete diplosiphon NIES-3275]EKF03309.1 response regulator [Tolypothrix sp. PCC 7601]MBE9082572.1 diguanylate cyclase [Tolypothrix sp. LEGE 11397]UYD27509.1 diguanylate cyclase [Tolypothrix sp. PCC 7712]UYD36629.1 diguanylate cyclase [Tolypothrix sp. PCC 7601]